VIARACRASSSARSSAGKSISIDSLYRVSIALEIALRELTDVRADKPSAVPSEETEKIFALVSGRRRPGDIRKAYRVLRETATGPAVRVARRRPCRQDLGGPRTSGRTIRAAGADWLF